MCLLQVYVWKEFNIRDDSHIRDAIKRSNVIINLTGLDKETWNYSFEDVHIDAATRIAQAAADNPLTERFVQFSCIGASENAASRRLRTKVFTHCPLTGNAISVACHSSCGNIS